MEALLNFGARKLLKIGGSYCLPIPITLVNAIHAGKGSPFDVELMEDRSIRISKND